MLHRSRNLSHFSASLILLTFASWLPATGYSQGAKQRSASFENLPNRMVVAANEMLSDQHLPGLGVVVVRDGETVFSRGFGFANLDKKLPVENERTIFRIGSISKALTLLTLTRQIDQGKIERGQSVERWIDGFSNPSKIEQPITIEHLLTHTTGLDQVGGVRQVKEFHLGLDMRKGKRQGLHEFLQDGNLRRIESPGATHRYDTYGTTLAGFVLGELYASSYPEVMRQEMFDVLGMDSSSVEVRDNQKPQLAMGYGYVDEEFQERPYEVYLTTPASSIDATPNDMGRLLEALTSDGANAHGRFLSSAMMRKVLSPQFRVHPSFRGMTHGLFESWTSDDGTRNVHLPSVGHGGNMDGFRSALTIIPSEKIGIFVVANRSPSAGGGEVDFRPLIDVVLDSIGGDHTRRPYELPGEGNTPANLQQYAGDYFYGVFCHTMTAQDQGKGAWRRGHANRIEVEEQYLKIRDEKYLFVSDDLFVEANGERMVYFQRDEQGEIKSFTYSTSPDTFERADESYKEFPSLAQEFYDLAAEGNLEIAKQDLLSDPDPSEYYVREEEFNNAGYALMNSGDSEAAITAFRFNAERYPASWNAHDSLAEALASAGYKQEAIKSYRRSLRLNPQNEAGRKRLKTLEARQ